MASTYSPALRLELMATGDQSGTWGDTTNTNLGTLLEQSITGYLSVAQGDVANLTLTTTNGASDQARNAVINVTGALTATRNVVVQTANKMYVVVNATTGGFSIVAKTSGGTGVSIPPGASMYVYSDGTNVVQAANYWNGQIGGAIYLDAGATVGPVYDLFRDSTSPAASDIMGQVVWNGRDSAGNKQEYASIETVIVDATSTSEDGQLDLYVTKAGSRAKFLSMTATATALTGAAAYTLDAPTTISNSAAGTMLTVTSTDAGAASGPNLELYRDSASPAASDTLSAIFFYGRDSAANKQEYAAIVGGIFDATSGSEDSYMTLRTVAAGATNAVLILGATAAGVAAPSSLGLPLGQISFPATANPSADANTLDDYEEGAWTPALTFGGNAVGMTFGSQAGTYTKIGNALFISGNFTLTAKGSSTGSARVTGFPFNLPAAQGAVITYYTNLATITGPVSVFTNNGGGATTADLVLGGAAGIAAVGQANFTNTSTIYFTLAIRGVS